LQGITNPRKYDERAAVKTQKERADEKRQAKLDLMQEQIEAGTLKIRKMTKKERAAHPPRERPAGSRRR
jgi:hypothetical protein